MHRLRIAIGRVSQESNGLSPVPTTERDFRRTHWKEDDALGAAVGPGGTEVEGFLRRAELAGAARVLRAAGAEIVPTLSAWAVPGGPLDAACFDRLVDGLVGRIRRAGALDGVVLSLHGAMAVDGVDRPEGALLAAVRDAAPGARVAVALDLHAQVEPDLVDGADVLVGYRTNPHRDHEQTGARAASLLLALLGGTLRPTVAWRTLPLIAGGGSTIDLVAPMRSIYRWMSAAERRPGVASVSLFHSNLWLSAPRQGWAAVATTHDDAGLAERVVDELAERLWAVRDVPPPDFVEPEEAVDRVRRARWRRRLGTACLCDTGDVVGAGAPGDGTTLLAALLAAPDLRSQVPVRDPAAVEACWALPIGRRVSLPVGGTLDPAGGGPIDVEAVIAGRADGGPVGRQVRLDAGGCSLVVCDGPPLAMSPAFFRSVGLQPWAADAVVVKSFFPFRMHYLAWNRLTLYVRTGGATELRCWDRLSVWDPVHPRDEVADWRPVDRARRGLEPEEM